MYIAYLAQSVVGLILKGMLTRHLPGSAATLPKLMPWKFLIADCKHLHAARRSSGRGHRPDAVAALQKPQARHQPILQLIACYNCLCIISHRRHAHHYYYQLFVITITRLHSSKQILLKSFILFYFILFCKGNIME